MKVAKSNFESVRHTINRSNRAFSRGGFPEACLASDNDEIQRWRRQYLENLVATALLKHVQYQYDVQGKEAGLHYIRTKDDAEVDFASSEKNELTQLVECKLRDDKPHRSLKRFAAQFPKAEALQLLRDLRHSFDVDRVQIQRADEWLNGLLA